MGTSIEGAMQLTLPSYACPGILLGDVSEPLQSIYETSSTQNYELGTKLVYGDGRIFRYGKNGGTNLAKAYMTTGEALNARALEEAQATYGTSAEIGDVELDIDVTTGGTWVENEYAGGFMVVNKVDGIGDIYKILANKINGSDDTLMRVRLETPLRTALGATSELTLVKSPWRDVDVMPTTVEGTPAGVPLVAVTADYYCWLQTGGYAPMLVDDSDTIVKGNVVGPAGTDAGAVQAVGADTTYAYGVAVYVASADEAAIIDLKLDS